MTWLLDRLKETSTWAAILGGAASLTGWAFIPEFQEEIMAVALAVVGLVAAITKEEKK